MKFVIRAALLLSYVFATTLACNAEEKWCLVIKDEILSIYLPGECGAVDSFSLDPEGKCGGSGCSAAKGGDPIPRSNGGERKGATFVAQQGGDADFRTGSTEFGATWANGGYLGSLLLVDTQTEASLAKFYQGPISTRNKLIASITPDNIFPRAQIYLDKKILLDALVEMGRGALVDRYPAVRGPLPPSEAQLDTLFHEIFSSVHKPLMDDPHFKVDWPTYEAKIKAQLIPQLIDVLSQRDLGIAEEYLESLQDDISAISGKVSLKEGGLLVGDEPVGRLNFRLGANSDKAYDGVGQAIDEVTLNTGGTYWLEGRNQDSGDLTAKSMPEAINRNKDLVKVSAQRIALTHQGGVAKQLANICISQAQYYLSEQDLATAVMLQKYAEFLLDATIKMAPWVGPGVTVYEAITGMSFVTGEELTVEQRLLSSVAAAGTIKNVSRAASLKVLEGLRRETQYIGGKGVERLSMTNGKAGTSGIDVKLSQIYEGAEVNASAMLARGKRIAADRKPFSTNSVDYEPPWDANGLVIEGKLKSPLKVIRFHNTADPNGRWVAVETEAIGLDAKAVRNHYNMPNEPRYRSKLTIPKDTDVRIGPVGPNRFGYQRGARQIELLESPSKEWFQPFEKMK